MKAMDFLMGGRAVKQDSFACIVAVMLTVAASAADIVFRAGAINELFEYDTAGYGALFVSAGIVAAVGALSLSAMILVTRTGRAGSLPYCVSAGITAVGFLLNMIFALLVRGSSHMSIEILLFAFSLVSSVGLGLASAGFVRPLKVVIVLGAASVLSIIAAFIPYFTGDFTMAESVGCLPFAVMIGAFALAAVGLSDEQPYGGENADGR